MSGAPSFDDLIAPLSLSDFYRTYWEREVLFLPAVDAKKFARLLTIADLDAYFSRSDIRHPALRLIKSGSQIPVESYTTTFSLGGQRVSDLIRPDRVLSHYRDGATILVQLAHWSLPTLQPFAVQLEKFFSFNVEMNVYLTPPHSQGFTAHFDTHSVIVLQLNGAKTWQLHGTRNVQPLLEDRFDESVEEVGDVESQIELTPGAFLYVPRGRFHSAKANSEPSLHVTIGLFPPTWLDIFHQRLDQLKSDARFRRAPVPGDTAKLAALVEAFGLGFDLAATRTQIASAGLSVEGQPAQGRLMDTIGLNALSIDSRLRVRHEATIGIERRSNRLVVRGIGSEVGLPLRAEPLVMALLNRQGEFRLGEVETNLDTQSVLVVARALVRDGVVALAGSNAA